jgi:hypothetical protein
MRVFIASLIVLLLPLHAWAGGGLTIVGEDQFTPKEIKLNEKLFKLSGLSARGYREKKCHKRSLKIVANSPICTSRGIGLSNQCNHPLAEKWLWFEGEVNQLTAICMKGIFFDERIVDGVTNWSEWTKILANVETLQPVYLEELAASDSDLSLASGDGAHMASPGEMLALGIQHLKGHEVIQDYVAAHMWFNLAAARGNKDAAEERDALAQLMTLPQIAEAQKRARRWMEKHPKSAHFSPRPQARPRPICSYAASSC